MINEIKCQTFYQKDIVPHPKVVENPVQFIEEMAPSHRKVLDYLLDLQNKCKYIYPTYATIAEATGLSVSAIKLSVAFLRRYKIINVWYRHRCSNFYKISSFFSQKEIRNKVSPWLRSCLYLPFVFLASLFMLPSLQANVIVGNINDYRHFEYNPYKNKPFNVQDQLNTNCNMSPTNLNKFIYKLDSRVSTCRETMYNEGQRVRARERGGEFRALGEIFQKKERKFMENVENPIPHSVRQLTFLNLSRWGQITLCQYPDIVLYDAFHRAEKYYDLFAGIPDKFGFFVKVCEEICTSNNYSKRLGFYHELRTKYKMPHNAPMMLKREILKDEGEPSSPMPAQGLGGTPPIHQGFKATPLHPLRRSPEMSFCAEDIDNEMVIYSLTVQLEECQEEMNKLYANMQDVERNNITDELLGAGTSELMLARAMHTQQEKFIKLTAKLQQAKMRKKQESEENHGEKRADLLQR